MAKYHINKKGEPAPCSATIQCPLSSDAPHFDDKNDARAYFESIMSPLPTKTEAEQKRIKALQYDNMDTVIAINESGNELSVGGKTLDNFEQVYDSSVSQGNSKEIADTMASYTEGESEFEDGLIELDTVSHTPLGEELGEHYANTFEFKGETYVVDMAYSEINPNTDEPYVDTLENWKKDLDRTSFLGKEKYVPPPPPPVDPRTFELPKFAPGEPNPLLERAVLSQPKKVSVHNDVTSRFLVIDDVKVAAVSYVVENGEPHLHSIETRAEYQNQGYMKKLLTELARDHNVDQVYSSSSFTQDGYNFTKHLTKPRDNEKAEIKHKRYNKENPFTFISDWVEGDTY